MKKTKFLKKTAFPAAPEYANGFVPPAGFGLKMSVSLRGKNIKIYGFDGTQWEMIHNTDGLVDDFIGNVLHQKYYFESKTGVEQIVRVSFLSQEEEPELELDFGTSHESRKFHHIEEVPVYRGGDEGKFLTVRTDGSLAWLGPNESYVVEVIGTGGGSQTPAPSLLSQSVPASNLATYNAETDVMTFNGSSTSYATFAGEYSFPDAITIATWFKTTATGMRTIMSSQVLNSSLGAANGWRMILDNGRLKYRHPSRNSFLLNGPSGLNNGEWQHVAMTWTPSGYTLYVNGVENATGTAGEAVGTDPNFDLHIGAIASTTTSNRTNVFSGQIGGAIVENEAMTAEQIQAIYNNGPEYVETIGPVTEETPAEATSSASPGSIVGLEEHTDLTLHGNAQLIDGVLHVDGTSGTYASLPHSLDYERENGDLTVSMWFKPNSLPNNWNAGLVSKMGTGWSGWLTAVSTMDADGPTGNMTQGGLQTSFFGGGNANNRYYPENGIALNEWQHAAFVMVAVGEYKMYHNGVEILSYNPTNRPQSTTGALRFGGWGPFNGYEGFFDGQIDGIKIEKVAKSADDILGEYNAGSSSEAPAVTYPIVGSLEDDTVNFSTWYTGTITEEGTFKHGSHSSSMFRSVAESDDYKIMEDTTITMWVKTPHFIGEKSLIKFGGWSGDSAKGVDILFDSRTTTARHAAGRSIMSSWTDGHLIVEVATDTHSASNDWAYRTYFKMPNIRDNEWHQIVVEFSNVGTGVGLAKGRVFVDGIKVTESFRDSNNVQQDENGYQELSRNPGDIVAGNKWITSQGFPAGSEFDGITIEKYLLTDEQIIAKYNAGR